MEQFVILSLLLCEITMEIYFDSFGCNYGVLRYGHFTFVVYLFEE